VYRPPAFVQDDRATLAALIAAHPLATLVAHTASGLSADPLPMHFDPVPSPDAPQGTLRGHVARANPLWRDAAGTDVLAVFHGPQAYVTPSWYPSKAATHKVVPTWNYVVVQARGPLRVVDDARWLHALVQRLTDTHEARRAQPWAVSDAPPAYVEQMLRAIVGIEIPVQRLEGKFKLSQNRSEADRLGVADGLAAEPEGATVAALVRRPPRPAAG
jgi:transcriptional regulator